MWNFSRAVSWIENLSTTRRVHKYASNFFLDIAPLLHQKQVSFRLNTCYMELKWGGVQCPRICESLFIPSWDSWVGKRFLIVHLLKLWSSLISSHMNVWRLGLLVQYLPQKICAKKSVIYSVTSIVRSWV